MSAANAQVIARLGVALRAVVEQRPGGRRCRGGVGEVVGEHLVDVGTAGAAQRIGAGRDRRVGAVDEFARRREIGGLDIRRNLPTGNARVTGRRHRSRADRVTPRSGGSQSR